MECHIIDALHSLTVLSNIGLLETFTLLLLPVFPAGFSTDGLRLPASEFVLRLASLFTPSFQASFFVG
jgi:hypothetical protein